MARGPETSHAGNLERVFQTLLGADSPEGTPDEVARELLRTAPAMGTRGAGSAVPRGPLRPGPAHEELWTLLADAGTGSRFSFRFELHGVGEGFAAVGRAKPVAFTDWERMDDVAKRAHLRTAVGGIPASLPSHADLDHVRWPLLDPSWKMEYDGTWTITSKPLSLDEAVAGMRALDRAVGDGVLEFRLTVSDDEPDWDAAGTEGSAFADWVERAANWVWLTRVEREVDPFHEPVDENRYTPGDLDNIANMRSSSVGRAVRVRIPPDRERLELEIRGLRRRIADFERLARVLAEGLRSASFGPWRHTSNTFPNAGFSFSHAVRQDPSIDLASRARADGGARIPAPVGAALERIQYDMPRPARRELVGWSGDCVVPLLPWELERSLDRATRRRVVARRREYLRRMVELAEEVATTGLSEGSARAFEHALSATRTWIVETRIAEALWRSLLPRPIVRVGSVWENREGSLALPVRVIRDAFERARDAIAQEQRMALESARGTPRATHAARLRDTLTARLVVERSAAPRASRSASCIRVSSGLLEALHAEP